MMALMNTAVKKQALLLAAVILPLFFLLRSTAVGGQNKVCFKKRCFNAEVARTIEELTQGLQFRNSMDNDAGMLFIFPFSGRHDFWMKDTLIPLDIIWLDEDKKVVYIAENVPPCREVRCETYGPPQAARYVLEINAGYASWLKIKVGDEAVFDLPE